MAIDLRPGFGSACWHVPDAPELVMFNGHHKREFIPHSHDVVTIVFVTKGAYEFQLDGEARVVRCGELVVVGADQIHSGRPVHPDGWEMRSLHVSPDFLARSKVDCFESDPHVAFSAPFSSTKTPAAQLFLSMHRRAESQSDADRQREQIEAFFHWFGDNLDLFQPRIGSTPKPDSELERAKALMLRDTFDNTPMECIAEEIGLSTYALIRRFKKQYGIPPHAWRMQVRANQVAQMLRDGMPLVDVATSCGFCDQSHMTRTFRSVFGVTPGQYRSHH